MSLQPNAYRALFPHLYSAFTHAPRRWKALKFPIIRVLGPFWSFGLEVSESGPADIEDLGPGAFHAFRLMQELRQPDGDGGTEFPGLRQPMLMRARAETFFSYDGSFPDDGRYESASRLSILAVPTLHTNIPADQRLWHMPVATGQAIAPDTTDLVLANIGEGPANTRDKHGFLPATQLLQGQIAFTPHAEYLSRVRKHLGLIEKPDMAQEIVLCPDGFAIYGAVPLPWTDKPVAGWFKATYRRTSSETLQPVLRPWVEGALSLPTVQNPPEDQDSDRVSWTEALNQLDGLLTGLRRSGSAPLWLELSAHSELTPEDFYWPVDNPQVNDARFDFLIGRPEASMSENSLFLDDRVFLARLAFRPVDGPPLTGLTIKPGAFEIKSDENGLIIRSSQTDVGTLNKAVYTYDGSQPEPEETVSFSQQDGVELAVPLVETASRLREAQNLPLPNRRIRENGAGPNDSDPDLVWTFAPLTQGWLHLPFPNATLDNINSLLGSAQDNAIPSEQEEDAAGEEGKRQTFGALGFFNRPASPGFRSDRRIWSFSLSAVKDAAILVRIDPDKIDPRYLSANVELAGGLIEFDGVLPITPFRHTSTRILPDHAERAVKTQGLFGVSPELLRGVEARMWRQAGSWQPAEAAMRSAVRTRLCVKNLTFRAQRGGTGTDSVNPSGDVDIELLHHIHELTLSRQWEARRPWLWTRQDILPTVQSLPLAVAGGERNKPSGTREFAPLRSTGGTGDDATLTFKFMGAVSSRTQLSELKSDLTWRRPTDQEAWLDEIGMVFLTLPSVTAFPGTATVGDKNRLPNGALDWFGKEEGGTEDEPGNTKPEWADSVRFDWSANVSTSLEFEIRHDLASRDESYATAAVPPTKAADGTDASLELKRPDAVFYPRSDNGPGRLKGGVLPSLWGEVFASANRQSALAATQDRNLVCKADGKKFLTGVFGEKDYELGSVSINSKILTIEADTDHSFDSEFVIAPTVFDRIGTLALKLDDDVIQFAGLPDDTDLTGVNRSFQRGNDTIEVRFGTARLGQNGKTDENGARPEQVTRDQRGLARDASEIADSAEFVLRSGELHQKSGRDKFALITLKNELDADETDDLKFWCADVPLQIDAATGDYKIHPAAVPESSLAEANSSAFDKNHLQGFRWYLRSNSTEGDQSVVSVGGLLFRPLSLHGLVLDQPAKAIREVRIRGQISLPLAPDELEWVEGTAGEVLLKVSWSGAEGAGDGSTASSTRLAKVEFLPLDPAIPVRWPLARASLAQAPVPYLEFKTFPAGGDTQSGTFHFEVAGRKQAVAVELKVSLEGGVETFQASIDREKDQKTAALVLKQIDIRAVKAASGVFVLNQASLLYSGTFGANHWGLTFGVMGDLLTGEEIQWSLEGGAVLKFGTDDDVQITATAQGIGFEASGFNLCFSWNTREAFPVLYDALALPHGIGRLTAALRPAVQEDGKPVLPEEDNPDHSAISIDFEVSCDVRVSQPGTPKPLKLEHAPGDDGFRLYGTLSLENLFKWPNLNRPPLDERRWQAITQPATGDPVFQHVAEVVFDGQLVRPGAKGEALRIPVRVFHEVTQTLTDVEVEEKEKRLSWGAYQTLVLRPLSTVLAELKSERPTGNADDIPLGPLGVAAFAKSEEIGVDHLETGSLFFHPDAARHSALTGRLREVFLTSFEEKNGAIAELSAHHNFLHEKAETAPVDLAILPLPHLSFLPGPNAPPLAATPEFTALVETKISAPLELHINPEDLPLENAFPKWGREDVARISEETRKKIGRAGVETWQVPALALGYASEDEAAQYRHRPVFQTHSLLKLDDGTWTLLALEYPGLVPGLALSVIMDRSSGPVRAFGFAEHGRVTRASLIEEAAATQYDPERYATSLRQMRNQSINHQIDGPAVKTADDRQEKKAVLLVVRTVNRAGDSIVVRASQSREFLGREEEIERRNFDVTWARRVLERLSPWAERGTISWYVTEGAELRPAPSHVVIKVARRFSTRPRRPQRPNNPLRRQPQLIAPPRTPPSSLPERLARGYRPIATDGALLASEDNFVPGGGTDGPRLTATALKINWSLEGGDAPILAPADTPGAGYWVLDRFRTSFREAAVWNNSPVEVEGGEPELPKNRLTPALPNGYHAGLPGGLMPYSEPPRQLGIESVDVSQNGAAKMRQPVLPGFMQSLRISPRAGIWTVSRLGAMQSSSNGTGLSASQLPLHARTPRPPLLALNDRTRASSYEAGHVLVKETPWLILHGPRRNRPGADGLAGGLDRTPRSLWATAMELAEPSEGLISNDWNGRVTFREVDHYGDKSGHWTAEKATLTVQGVRYQARILSTRSAKDSESQLDGAADTLQEYVFEDFRTGTEGAGTRLLDVLPSIPPATEPLLTIEMKLRPGAQPQSQLAGVNLVRQVHLSLLTSGSGLGLTEMPVYARFDDPEYNDRLTGQATISKEFVPSTDALSEFVFAVDRRDARKDDRIEAALALRASDPDQANGLFFTAGEEGRAMFQNEPLSYSVERLRPGSDGALPSNHHLVLQGEKLDRETGAGFSGAHQILQDAAPGQKTEHLALRFPLERAVLSDGGLEDGAVLQAGDQVKFTIWSGSGELKSRRRWLQITLDVVLTPLYPGNPSSFAFLCYQERSGAEDGGKIRTVGTPLYSYGPEPAVNELVDPLDLIDGVVRRRATYLWRAFAEKDTGARFALQKINSVGGTWIENDLAEGWQACPSTVHR